MTTAIDTPRQRPLTVGSRVPLRPRRASDRDSPGRCACSGLGRTRSAVPRNAGGARPHREAAYIRRTRRLPSLELDDRLMRADELSALDEDAADLTSGRGADLVEELHRLDEADDIAGRDLRADLDERVRLRRRRAVEDPGE